MEIILTTEDGHPVLSVTYDPAWLDWSEAIHAAIAACGVDPRQVTVSARPVS